MWLILSLLALLVALPLVREMGRRPILQRQSHPEGRLERLSHGLTHIREDRPAGERPDGRVAVLVHGLTTPSFVFDGLVPDLVARGYRVIRYDHYGRGLSDRPRIPQNAATFRQHLSDILDVCRVTEPAVLIGYSMGGAVVADFAAAHPERVARLVLLAPGGMKANVAGLLQLLMRVPVLGPWLFHMRYPGLLRKGVEAERAVPGTVPNIADRQLEEMRYRGFVRLVYASLQGLLAAPMENTHRQLAQLDIPVTALFGEIDDVIPLAARDLLAEWNPFAHLITIPGAGHGLTYTHSTAVVDAL